jgi:hypothetical protein
MHVTNQAIGIPPGLFWLGNDIRKRISIFSIYSAGYNFHKNTRFGLVQSGVNRLYKLPLRSKILLRTLLFNIQYTI